jgi:hypothetical protein
MARTDAAYRDRVRAKYNALTAVWDDDDRWHAWSHRQIAIVLDKIRSGLDQSRLPDPLVVDVGSGGDSYGILSDRRIDIDIAEKHLDGRGWKVCANAELLPLSSGIADLTICVGPVINYCSLEEALGELARVTKRRGLVVVHIELSNSWEFFGTDSYRSDAAFVTTFYKGAESLWVYSDAYIRRIAIANGLALERAHYFHLLSSFLYRLTRRPNFAAQAASADPLFQRLPGAQAIADSSIYVFRKAN